MTLETSIWLLLLPLVATAASITAAVVAASFARRSARGTDQELRGQVDELAILVERLAKAARRERMQKVRAAAAESEASPPPELNLVTPPQSPLTRKAELRRRLLEQRFGG